MPLLILASSCWDTALRFPRATEPRTPFSAKERRASRSPTIRRIPAATMFFSRPLRSGNRVPRNHRPLLLLPSRRRVRACKSERERRTVGRGGAAIGYRELPPWPYRRRRACASRIKRRTHRCPPFPPSRRRRRGRGAEEPLPHLHTHTLATITAEHATLRRARVTRQRNCDAGALGVRATSETRGGFACGLSPSMPSAGKRTLSKRSGRVCPLLLGNQHSEWATNGRTQFRSDSGCLVCIITRRLYGLVYGV